VAGLEECLYRAEPDIEKWVWTPGGDFPPSRLESWPRCPMSGSRGVTLRLTNRETTAGDTQSVPRRIGGSS